MNTKLLKILFCAMATVVIPTLGVGASPTREPGEIPAYTLRDLPTPEQALKYAQSVVLLKRAIQNNQIHSYVKEVWRSDPDTATLPSIGSEYGQPMPYNPQIRFPECDAIVFEFGADRPKGLPKSMRISVNEKRRVPAFLEEVTVLDDAGAVRRFTEEPMHVEDVRSKVKRTKPEKPTHPPEPTRSTRSSS